MSDFDRYFWCPARRAWADTPTEGNAMSDLPRLKTLLDLLRALADAVEQRFGGGQPTHPTPPDTDVDQALAHAGDVARRLRLDPAALLQQQQTPRVPDSDYPADVE